MRCATPVASRRAPVLLTAHDLHEAPWGDGRQLDQLIREGLHGDAVLLPEPLCDVLPVAGRGSATWKVVIRRAGAAGPRSDAPRDEPSVIAAAAELVARLSRLDSELARDVASGLRRRQRVHRPDPLRRDLQPVPARGWLEGTRRWLPGDDHRAVEARFRAMLAQLAADTRTTISCDWMMIRDAFALDPATPLVAAFQECYRRVELGLAAAGGPQAVRRRRQQLLGAGGNAGDHPRPACRRPAHGLGMGRDRRPGAGRQALCGHRGRFCTRAQSHRANARS